MLKNVFRTMTPSIFCVSEFMCQLFILLLVLAVPGEPEPVLDNSGGGSATLGSPLIEDSVQQHISGTGGIQKEEAEISDEGVCTFSVQFHPVVVHSISSCSGS